MKTNKILLAAVGLALAGFGMNANALNKVTGSISPAITLTAACSIDTTALNVIFPATPAGVASTPTIGPTNVKVICSGFPYKLYANAGLHEGTPDERRMLSGLVATDFVSYILNINDGSAHLWGDFGITTSAATMSNAATPAVLATNGTAAGETYPVTGSATVTAALGAATYTDVVALTLEW